MDQHQFTSGGLLLSMRENRQSERRKQVEESVGGNGGVGEYVFVWPEEEEEEKQPSTALSNLTLTQARAERKLSPTDSITIKIVFPAWEKEEEEKASS